MCGILFGNRNDGRPIAKSLIKRYQDQSSRGKQGFGYLTIENGKVTKVERAMYEHDIMKKLQLETASCILFHHRIPTSTENTIDTTHPFIVNHKSLKKRYYFIHNGHVANCNDLFVEHNKLGFEYGSLEEIKTETKTIKRTRSGGKEVITSEKVESSFNDSESLAIDFALTIEGHQDKMKSRGSIAFICIQTDKRDNVEKIYYGKNHNPIVFETSNDMAFLKSAGRGEALDADVLYILDFASGAITENDFEIGARNPVGFQPNKEDKQEDIQMLSPEEKSGYFNDYDEWMPYERNESIRSPYYHKSSGTKHHTRMLDFTGYDNDMPLLPSGKEGFIEEQMSSDAERYFKAQNNKKLVDLYEQQEQTLANISFWEEERIKVLASCGDTHHPEDQEEIDSYSQQIQEESDRLRSLESEIDRLEAENETITG